jgi:hypothetical protein
VLPIARIPSPQPLASLRALGLPVAGLPPITIAMPGSSLAPAMLDSLIALGRHNDSGVWPLDGDLANARNKHVTNRLGELRDGLIGGYDWLEADVRVRGGVPIASHDATVDAGALRMADWVRVGAATERGLKLDFKERAAIAPTLDLVAKAGVPDERLVINVSVLGRDGLTLAQLRRIRARFPRATINLSPDVRAYTAVCIAKAVALATALGGPVAFPLDAARLDANIVRGFRAGGRVAAWNDPARWHPRDIAATALELRAWGVDGTIDLR